VKAEVIKRSECKRKNVLGNTKVINIIFKYDKLISFIAAISSKQGELEYGRQAKKTKGSL